MPTSKRHGLNIISCARKPQRRGDKRRPQAVHRKAAVTVNQLFLREALELTALDRAKRRTAIEEDCLMDDYVAEFVAESESLEGHDSAASEVLASARALGLT